MNLNLDNDEGIILHANYAMMRKGDNFCEDCFDLYLTNKNIICHYKESKGKGIFAPVEDVIENIPLKSIKVVDNNIQVLKLDDDELELQLFIKDGGCIQLIFEEEKELDIWYDSILDQLLKMNKDTDISTNEKNHLKENLVDNSNEKSENKSKEDSMVDRKIKYCSKCGKEININSKFCTNCGAQISYLKEAKYTTNNENNIISREGKIENNKNSSEQRQVIYDGKIHKCPNCGEILNSFVIKCPSCGYELRDISNPDSVKELYRKLELLEENRVDRKTSSVILGELGFNNNLSKTDEQKIALIRSFPIPNTKEDLYEFFVLSKSNIDIDLYQAPGIKDTRLALSNAWKAKFEQAYQKAKLVFANDNILYEIEQMYNDTHKSINKMRTRPFRIILVVIILMVLMFASMIAASLIY